MSASSIASFKHLTICSKQGPEYGAYAAASQDLRFTTNLVTYQTTLVLTHLQTTCADSLHRVETPTSKTD